MIDSLDKRARQVRARVAVRAWEYRQRKHSKGVWFRLRRVLADAAIAYAIPDVEVARLLSEGLAPEPVGAELEPARQIFFLSPERLGAMHDRRTPSSAGNTRALIQRTALVVRHALLMVRSGAMRSLSVLLLAALTLGCAADNGALRDDPRFARLHQKKVLVVVTSHGQFGSKNRKTGYWLEEVSHFYYELERVGFEVDIVSPRGGAPPMDPESAAPEDDINRAFLDNERARRKLANTMRPEEARAEDYVVVYFAGGHGAMWDFRENRSLATIAASVYERGGVVAAVCHGPSGLLGIKLSDGRDLIAGKKVTGFTNEEEGLLFLKSDVPFLLEDALDKKSGGNFVQALFPFTAHAVVSERVVTGQNPMSTGKTARAVIEALRTIAEKDAARRESGRRGQ